ncbi:MAG: quinolinate synthase NadA, partial [Planctomycetes bacterium]|nr:quinolinate synthase NadA [Planctomycetota bacterium]
ECPKTVRDLSDEILSTSQMLKYVQKNSGKQFIITTEIGIIHTLKKQNPNTEFIAATEKAICPNMKKITLEKVLWALEDMQYEITVPEQIRQKAKKALDRMVETLPAE